MRTLILCVILASSMATSALAGGCPPYADGSVGTDECYTGRMQDDQLSALRYQEYQGRRHTCLEDCSGGLLLTTRDTIYRIDRKKKGRHSVNVKQARELVERVNAAVYLPGDSDFDEIATRFLVQTK